MFRILICDDDRKYIEYLKKLIIKAGMTKEEVVFFECSSGVELFEQLDKEPNVDLIILDIQLKKESGSEIATELRKYNKNVVLVFCSGVYLPSPENIKVSPYRFLLKKFSEKEMLEEMQDIIKYLIEREVDIPLLCRDGDKEYLINSKNIMYVEIAKRGTTVYVQDGFLDGIGELHCKNSMEEVCEILKEKEFLHIHYSQVVNMNYIVSKNRNTVTLVNGKILTVARSKTNEVKTKLAYYLGRKYEE